MLSEFLEVLLLKNYNTRLVVLSTSLLGLGCALVGSFLLLRKRSLMGDALSHATLPGIGLAFAAATALGFPAKSLPILLLGATLSGVLGMLVMLAIRNTTRLRDDVAMGFVLSVFFGAGTAILSMVQTIPGANAAGLESFIYGKTASMVASDFQLIAAAALLTSLTLLLLHKELTLLCFDEAYAKSEGWPTLLLDLILLTLVTAITVIGLQAVGLILIIAYLIIPAAAARFWTEKLSSLLLLAALIGAISGWLGATLSALFSRLPAGALIVLSAAAFFLISLFFGTARGVLPRWLSQRRLTRRIGRQHLLRAVYEILESEGDPVRNHPVSRTHLLSHRSWSPTQLNALLRQARREDHLAHASHPDQVALSESGFGEAIRLTRNHRLWELYLITHADIAPSHVDRDADLVEHILGPEMVRELEKELADSSAIPPSPHPI